MFMLIYDRVKQRATGLNQINRLVLTYGRRDPSMGTLWLRHAPSSAAVARHRVSDALERCGASESDSWSAALIASELVGNAVLHAPALPSGNLVVDWSLDGESFFVSVTDGGAAQDLAPRQPAVSDSSGRGLSIVEAIAHEWGVTPGDGCTTVWARGTLKSRQPSAISGRPIYA
jgi:anti-sigma regulatory factor (Ser/Thr protein kinase)